VDKSRYRSFFVDQQLGKYLTMIAKSLHQYKISDLQAYSPKYMISTLIDGQFFGHFAQSLPYTASPTHPTELSTKLSTVLVENHSRSSEDYGQRERLSQLWDSTVRLNQRSSRVPRIGLGAGNKRILQSLRWGGAGVLVLRKYRPHRLTPIVRTCGGSRKTNQIEPAMLPMHDQPWCGQSSR
jgi:hypothetical protein